MPKFTTLKPTLYTKQLKETVQFYTTVLGFVCADFDEILGWAFLVKDDVEIMFAYPNEHIPFNGPENFKYGMREFAVMITMAICCNLASSLINHHL